MDLAPFETLLQTTMGLNPASIGSSAIARAIRGRLRAIKIADPAAYLELVRGSRTELQELIEAVIVPETWFFRDRQAFAALAQIAQEEWRRARPDETIRLLSVPCSTGEEPYSIAMALIDAGISPERFRIDAVDISERALAHAQRAIYGPNSFRARDLAFRDAHFQPEPPGFRLADGIRREVTFQHGNLLEPGFRPGEEIYHAILCRNLLIYFDQPTQDRAIRVLTRLLKSDGWLFVGPAETPLLRTHGFVAAETPFTFAFRKPGAVTPEPKRRSPHRTVPLPLTSRRMPAPVVSPRAAPAPKPARPIADGSATDAKTSTAEAALVEVLRLADAGQLADASRCYDQLLQQHGPSAQAYYVGGLVRDAGGQAADARELYRRAIYLDPNHHEALVHLAILLEQQGDLAGAKVLHTRARRLDPRKTS